MNQHLYNPLFKNILLWLGFLGVAIMLLWETIYLGKPDLNKAPAIWFFGGILTTICLWGFSLLNQDDTNIYKVSRIKTGIGLSILIITFMMLCVSLNNLFLAHPIVAAESDIIPSLQAYVQRFLSGEKVYVAIPFENYEVWPTYFPAMWMPYIIPEWLGADYRWMPVFSFFAVYAYIIWNVTSEKDNWLKVILSAIAPFVILNLLRIHDKSVFAFATELMPISFYMLLFYGLFKRNYVLIGIALGLCTMSRYAYTLWIIPFIVILWYSESFKALFKVGWIGLSVIVVLYVIPFLLFDPAILTDGLKYYGKTADDQWKVQYWQEEGSIPYHLGRGLSFSHWIYKEVEGDYLEKVAFAKSLHKSVCLAFSLLQILIFFLFRKRWKWEEFLMVGLFSYLLVFYAFFYVPFSYLYILPLLAGLMCWVLISSKKELNK